MSTLRNSIDRHATRKPRKSLLSAHPRSARIRKASMKPTLTVIFLVALSPLIGLDLACHAQEAAKTYFPGLGDFMARIQVTHAKLWLAGEAKNWELAEYEVGEIKETFSDVQDYVPRYRNIPVGEMI